jgi:hypothetical protein
MHIPSYETRIKDTSALLVALGCGGLGFCAGGAFAWGNNGLALLFGVLAVLWWYFAPSTQFTD